MYSHSVFGSADLKFPHVAAHVVWIGALFLVLPGHPRDGARRDPRPLPAYIKTGQRAQQNFDAYSKRLEEYYESLAAALTDSAPDLRNALHAPRPMRYGYQVLPPIMPEAPPLSAPRIRRSRSAAYSWPWTNHLIENEWGEIVRAQAELRRALALPPARRRSALQRLVSKFERMNERRKNIEAHLQYNRFWQSAIAANRQRYDRETRLHDATLLRQEILSASSTGEAQHGVNRTSVASTGDLKTQAALLGQRSADAIAPVNTPPFVSAERRADGWVLRVPLYTDIEDRRFVESARQIIQSTWRVQDGKHSYRVQLDISHIPAGFLYAESAKPVAGQPIDLLPHLRRFPAGAAILTTGAATTHVRGRAIILGPQPLASYILAHEFGHVLGFRDAYFRGYKDLGAGGFEILEIVADPHDIMGSAPTGSVLRHHFERVLAGKFAQSAIAPEHRPARERSNA